MKIKNELKKGDIVRYLGVGALRMYAGQLKVKKVFWRNNEKYVRVVGINVDSEYPMYYFEKEEK